ncbi:MAG: TIGR03016 family PEP-CTERM system-associated outer membrane protein [Candidatus Thiodiazotropha sp.]
MMTFQSIPFNVKKLTMLLGGYAIAMTPPAVNAAEWIVSPAVRVGQIYTDNALLTNSDTRSESITQIRPSISLYKEGARATVDINYAPQYNRYWQDTQNNELIHYLRADGKTELLEDHLYVNGWANADVSNISSISRTGVDALSGRNNTTEVYTVGVSPYFTAHMSNFATLEARYTADSVNYSAAGLDDNKGQRADLVVGSGSAFNNQIWELSASKNVVDYHSLSDNNESTRYKADFIQQLTHQWALAFAAGHESYKPAITPDLSGSIWSVGFIYTPTPRTRLAMGGGERAFGSDYYLDFNHRSARSVWTANYRRDYTTARDEVMHPTLFGRHDAFGNLVRDAVLDNPPVIERGDSPTLGPDYYEIEEFTTSYTLATGRSTLNINAGQTKRIYDLSVDNTRDLRVGAWLRRNLSQRLDSRLRLDRLDHKEQVLDYKQWVAAIEVGYTVGANSSLSASLAHLKRNAQTDADSYDENRIGVYFTSTF